MSKFIEIVFSSMVSVLNISFVKDEDFLVHTFFNATLQEDPNNFIIYIIFVAAFWP